MQINSMDMITSFASEASAAQLCCEREIHKLDRESTIVRGQSRSFAFLSPSHQLAVKFFVRPEKVLELLKSSEWSSKEGGYKHKRQRKGGKILLSESTNFVQFFSSANTKINCV
jgi:hypothetical protein